MPYYPKHYIITDLYTNGDEYVYAANPNIVYVGPYYKLANGEVWSGQTPQYPYRQLLVPATKTPQLETVLEDSKVTVVKTSDIPYGITENLQQSFQTSDRYTGTNLRLVQDYTAQLNQQTETVRRLPLGFEPSPSEQDYTNGQFERFFCKRVNQNAYLELSSQTYNALNTRSSEYYWELYIIFKLTWKLTGLKQEVELVNRRYVQQVSNLKQLQGLDLYLDYNYLKYYRQS